MRRRQSRTRRVSCGWGRRRGHGGGPLRLLQGAWALLLLYHPWPFFHSNFLYFGTEKARVARAEPGRLASAVSALNWHADVFM